MICGAGYHSDKADADVSIDDGKEDDTKADEEGHSFESGVTVAVVFAHAGVAVDIVVRSL